MILLIEPSKDLAKIIKEAFSREGIECSVAHTADDAIKLADEINPKAVVIELLMPRHNGLEFIYEFRSYADWFDIPIIVHSQLSAEELGLNQSLQRDIGITAHLYKPTSSLDKLASEVMRSLETHEAPA